MYLLVSKSGPNRYYNAAGTTETKHVFAGDLMLATMVTVGATTTPQYVHTDHLGGTSVVSDENGEVAEVTDYYPYGAQRISSGSFSEQRKFIGEEYDAGVGLNYLNARYYDSARGQFTRQDPVFWEIGQTRDGTAVLANPQLQNSYSYAGNNPIVMKDPEGRVGIAAPLVVGGLVIAGGIALHYLTDAVVQSVTSGWGTRWAGPVPTVDFSRYLDLSGSSGGPLPSNPKAPKWALI